MSLIITNNKTLKNKAIIILGQAKGEITEDNIGDLTIISSNNEVIGINIFNIDGKIDVKEGAHTLNLDQVKQIKDMGYEIKDYESKFSIGEVLSKEVHPKSDRLFVLKVMTSKEIQIVTNAANAEVGKQVVVANVGATLPSGLEIKDSKVMGVESEGMLCGGETLGKEKTDGVLLVNGINGEKFIL